MGRAMAQKNIQGRSGGDDTQKDNTKSRENSRNETQEWEFGGPLGAAGIMLFSVFLCYWLWLSCIARDGTPFLPYWPLSQCWQEIKGHLVRPQINILHNSVSSLFRNTSLCYTPAFTATCYRGMRRRRLAHVVIQAALYPVLPGPDIYGYPVPEEGNKRLRCVLMLLVI